MRRIALIAVALVAVAVAAIVVTGAVGTAAAIRTRSRAIFDDAAFAVPGRGRPDRRRARRHDQLDGRVHREQRLVCSRDLNKAAVTFADRQLGVHAVPRQRNLRDPAAVADRREVRRLQPRDRERAAAAPRSPAAPAPGPTCCRSPRPARRSTPTSSRTSTRSRCAQQFSIIINELGTGLAARGSDLNAVIHRANPALGYTDQVLKILARQNRQLAQLATRLRHGADAAGEGPRGDQADFVVQANTTSVASAARATDIARSFHLLPAFLRQLRPLMVDLGGLADQGTPLLNSPRPGGAGARRAVRGRWRRSPGPPARR